AFEELLQERKDLLYELMAEIIEDFGLLRAIKEGEDTAAVPREEVFQIIESGQATTAPVWYWRETGLSLFGSCTGRMFTDIFRSRRKGRAGGTAGQARY
ncbi:MAG: hypothetical protein L6306_04210, partial [Planctomycetales bacterium]|nr:hypothetical protein [Planctomycetales bacterium]